MEKVISKEQKQVPKSALFFADTAVVEFADATEGELKKGSMFLYSGSKVDHWYWGKTVIDVEGIDFSQHKKYPILENHDTDKKIGFSDKVELNNNVFFPEIKLLSNAHAEEFYNNAREGFPYQASISIRPTLLERVEKEESTEVNGMKLKGPLTVFRKSLFREGSICVHGVDTKTDSSVFAEFDVDNLEYEILSFSDGTQSLSDHILTNPNQEDVIMDLKELKEKYPNLVTEVENSVKEEMTKVVEQKDKEISDLQTQVASLSDEKTDSAKRIADLEKREAIRTEKEMKASADSVLQEKLSLSKIPQRLHEKVTKHINYSEYVKEGVFDKAEFTKAVDDEIKDWESNFDFSEPVVKGINTHKEIDNVDQSDSDDDVDRLMSYLPKQ